MSTEKPNKRKAVTELDSKKKRKGEPGIGKTSFGKLQNLDREKELPPESVLLPSAVTQKSKKFPMPRKK